MILNSRNFIPAAAGALALAFAASASADVFVFGDIFKLKRKTVTEDINITKTITLDIVETIEVDAAAEQEIVKNQRIQYNQIEDETSTSATLIDNEVAGSATGLVLINQASGLANNQGNELSVTYANDVADGVFTHAQSAVQQFVGASYTRTITADEGAEDVTVDIVEPSTEAGSFPGLPFANTYQNINPDNSYSDTISGNAFSGFTGVVGVNQAAGALNNQNNALAIALGDDSRFALGEADLGQFVAFNAIRGNVQTRTDTITSSALGGVTGIATINQAAGIGNNQVNQIDIAASTGVSLPDLSVPNGLD
jgi:hypothetical protein